MDKLHWLHHQMCLARVSEQQSKTIFCANLFFQTLQFKQTFILFLISNAFPLKGLGENHFNNLKKKKSMQNIFIFNITFPSQCHSLIYGLATYFSVDYKMLLPVNFWKLCVKDFSIRKKIYRISLDCRCLVFCGFFFHLHVFICKFHNYSRTGKNKYIYQ